MLDTSPSNSSNVNEAAPANKTMKKYPKDFERISGDEAMKLFQEIVERSAEDLKHAGIFNVSSLPPLPGTL